MPEICDGQMDIRCNVLKKLAEKDFSNLSFLRVQPTPFWEKLVGEDLWWEKISQTHPFLKVSALKTSKKGRFEKLVGEDFSDLPLFQSFSPENFKKG